jgi:hypothetical protein
MVCSRSLQDIELLLNEDARYDVTNADLEKYHAWRATVPDWEPYRTECVLFFFSMRCSDRPRRWSVFHEEACISGQIDSLWRDKEGNFHMADWKARLLVRSRQRRRGHLLLVQRCKHIELESSEKGYHPFHKLPNTNWGHYCVQQNAYAYMLKTKYGIDCKTLSLVQLHPDVPTFLVWKLDLMPEEMALAFCQRADAVRAGEIVGMVSASAGKPPLSAEQQAALDAEKECDLRVVSALLSRAQALEEKWAPPERENKRKLDETL